MKMIIIKVLDRLKTVIIRQYRSTASNLSNTYNLLRGRYTFRQASEDSQNGHSRLLDICDFDTVALLDKSICLSDKGGVRRYTVSWPYTIKHYKIRKEEYPKFRIKKAMNNAITEQDAIKIINQIQSRRFKGDCNYVYVCPICGNSLTIEAAPMQFGDDNVCKCLVCGNTFVFGGTYPIDFKFTALADLFPSPHELAYEAMLTRCKKMLAKEGKYICQFDDVILIIEKLINKYQVTHVMRLCK